MEGSRALGLVKEERRTEIELVLGVYRGEVENNILLISLSRNNVNNVQRITLPPPPLRMEEKSLGFILCSLNIDIALVIFWGHVLSHFPVRQILCYSKYSWNRYIC